MADKSRSRRHGAAQFPDAARRFPAHLAPAGAPSARSARGRSSGAHGSRDRHQGRFRRAEESAKPLHDALKALKIEAELKREEEHSAMDGDFQGSDQRGARRSTSSSRRSPNTGACAPSPGKPAKFNQPPFVVVRDTHRETQSDWRDLLAYVKNEGTREVNVQRYKGLGEMNAEQLWETTMNIETRTLLKVSLEDLAQSRSDLHHADGRGCGKPPQVYRGKRAGRAQSGRVGRPGSRPVGRASSPQPAACYQQACSSVNKSRLVGGCGLVARPTFRHRGDYLNPHKRASPARDPA